MNRTWRIVAIIGALILGTATIGTIWLQAGLVVWEIIRVSELETSVSDTFEMLADQYIDAGYEDPVLRADDPLLKDRKILLGHDVNARTAKDVTARLFYLNSLDHERPIDLYISTLGGWGDNAFTIVDAMRLIEAPVNTWAIGGCYSSGALILAAGTGRRIATDNAIIMVHANLDDSSNRYSFGHLALARYENLFRKTTELPESWYPMTSDKRFYLSAKEARHFKLIDEIVHTWPAEVAEPHE